MRIQENKKLRVAILGSGNIGMDLLYKINRSNYLECTNFIGRNQNSERLKKAREMGIKVSTHGVNELIKYSDSYDLIFDATSASSHYQHAKIFKDINKKVIDLTPAKIGNICVPVINMKDIVSQDNVNMITCGGQASAPIAYALKKAHSKIEYIEIISSISSNSAGSATRQNIDEYINTTEFAIQQFSGCKQVKAILNLNPAIPAVDMKTTIFAKILNPNMIEITKQVTAMVQMVKSYVPGYELIVDPELEHDRIITMIRVKGSGDYLPEYAGNLDIITCAAIAAAEEIAKNHTARQ